MSAPIVTWYGKKTIDSTMGLMTDWNLDTIDANTDSVVWEVEIWNGKGQAGLSKMENCAIITKTYPDLTDHMENTDTVVYDETNDPVGGKWVMVHRPNKDQTSPTEVYNAVGNGTRCSIKAVNDTVPEWEIWGDDPANQSSDKKHAFVKLKIHVPNNAISGNYQIVTRVEYQFI